MSERPQQKTTAEVRIRLTGDLSKIQQIINSLDATIEITYESKPHKLRNGQAVSIYIKTRVND